MLDNIFTSGDRTPASFNCAMQLAVSKTSDTLDLYNRVIGMDVCSDNGCVGAAAAAFSVIRGVDKRRVKAWCRYVVRV